MKLSEIMTTNVTTVHPEASLRDAAALMKSKSVGMLPVVDRRKVVGVVTDRDIVVRGLTTGSESQLVKHVMTHSPVTVRDNSEASRALKTMGEHKVGRLIVVDERDHLVGVVSATDIAASDGDPRKVRNLVGRLGEAHKAQGQGRPLTRL